MAVDEFYFYLVELAELEERTGLVFPAVLHAAGMPLAALAAARERDPRSETADIQWQPIHRSDDK